VRAVASAFYRNPVVFLGAVQLGLTTAAAQGAITGWIPVVSLAIVTGLQRTFVKPKGAL
jgi:hypothetical protein